MLTSIIGLLKTFNDILQKMEFTTDLNIFKTIEIGI